MTVSDWLLTDQCSTCLGAGRVALRCLPCNQKKPTKTAKKHPPSILFGWPSNAHTHTDTHMQLLFHPSTRPHTLCCGGVPANASSERMFHDPLHESSPVAAPPPGAHWPSTGPSPQITLISTINVSTCTCQPAPGQQHSFFFAVAAHPSALEQLPDISDMSSNYPLRKAL
jgi:hypothetical protein